MKENAKLMIFTLLYWRYITHFILLNWKYVHNVFTVLPDFQSLFKVSLLFFSSWPLSLCWRRSQKSVQSNWTFFQNVFKVIQTLVSTKAQSLFISAYVIRHLTSRCLERKERSRVGGSPLCDVVSSFLCHTHTDGKDKLLEWRNCSCLLLYVNRIHIR
jgi:hypothetical protein